jgi:phosphosulfolactate synthase (CoM biosynthesis protein A)
MKQEDDQTTENLFTFLNTHPRAARPRTTGITGIRGPYYQVTLQDALATMGQYIDSLKFAGDSFALIHPKALHISLKQQMHTGAGGLWNMY